MPQGDKIIHNLKYADITERIIGGAMKVHSAIGPGFPEKIYHRSLLIEFSIIGLKCASEVERDIFYRGIKVGCRRLDILVEEKVLIELKAISEMDNGEVNQIINYLNLFQLEVGLLLNFGKPSLQFKRFVNSK
ncbi:MAG: GxxExxY protein [Ferruginibacter sp.]